MKLIAYGKVMEDDNKTLKDYSIKEGDFIVVMISKVSYLIMSLHLLRQSQPQKTSQRMLSRKSQLRHNQLRISSSKPNHNQQLSNISHSQLQLNNSHSQAQEPLS
jgi:hypothetical protein